MPLIFGETASGLLIPVLVDDDGVLAAGAEGWISSAWQKNPLLLGYSGDKTEVISDLSADEGTNTLLGAAVPAGEIWIVEAIALRNVNKSTVALRVCVVVNGTTVVLKQITTSAVNEFVSWTGAITLSEDDTAKGIFLSCDAGNDIHLNYHARRIDIDQ